MPVLPEPLRARARTWLAGRVRAELEPRRRALEAASLDLSRVRARLPELDRALRTAAWRADRRPFSGDMTVHEAHARNDGVAAVFARRGLPGCTDCAVGADETLAEAASGEGFELDELIRDLNALEW